MHYRFTRVGINGNLSETENVPISFRYKETSL
jgi:hypothetical protein